MEKTYSPKDFEKQIYNSWIQNNYFSAAANKDKKPFTVMMPPPNITGQLHIGHALDLSIQDAVIRFKRMNGYEALYMPGTDHASIATEVKIVEKLREEGVSKEQLGREGFLKRAFKWKDEFGGRIVEQQKRLGLSCDWERLAFTMDEERSVAVKEVFVNLFEKGLIYKGDRIINWCPCCKTALSDAEVEYAEADSHLWHIKYPFTDGSGFITVATTRPETMLGDTAVAVSPNDARYKKAVGKYLTLPLTGRQIPVIADSYVDAQFGSGAVKITPAHDPNDFEVGKRHNLPLIKVMDENGMMNDEAGIFKGLAADKARFKVAEELQKQGFLVRADDYKNNVGHCYRCHKTVEPIISKQWFVRMDKLSQPAIDAVKTGEIKFIPKRFEKMFLHWMQNTRDWCVSRQLWWGHRIPVYYCACGEMTVSKTEITKCPHCGGKVRQDEDVLDTWFSSALWPFSTLNWPQKNADLDYFYPTNLLVTAYDIIGFWVSRMIFSGIEHTQKIPFSEVLIHGIVRDKEGKKMSKSSGNGVDPLEVIDVFGADVLRISLINGVTMGGDMKYSTDKLEGYRNFMNKIWNAARFVLINCGENCADVKPEDIFERKRLLSPADKWILGRLNITVGLVSRLMDKYEIGLASSLIYDFIWNEFCDWYIEKSKVSLLSGDANRRNLTLNVLLYVLREMLKLAHPIIPFITAEIYKSLPNKDAADIMVSPYPVFKKGMFKDAVKSMEEVMAAIRNIRNLRHEMNVGQNRRTSVYIKPAADKETLVKASLKYIQKLGFASDCEAVDAKPDGKMAVIATTLGEIYIPIGQLVDTETEIQRLNKELENVKSEIERAEGKLANAGFVQKAPPALIASEQEKLAKYIAERDLIIVSIEKLKHI